MAPHPSPAVAGLTSPLVGMPGPKAGERPALRWRRSLSAVNRGNRLRAQTDGVRAVMPGKEPDVKSALLLLAVLPLAMPASAATDVMSFEDLVLNPASDFLPVPDGYRGLDWQGVRVFDPAAWGGGIYLDLYRQGIASGTVVATNSPVMSISSATPFDFVGAFLSSAEGRPIGVEVYGSAHGEPLYMQSYALDHLSGRFYDFGFVGVDTLSFVSNDGGPTRFSMDEFTIRQPVPEPAAWGLMLAGLVGLAGAGRLSGSSPPRPPCA